MKPSFLRKTSGLLATFLMLSALLPVLAFAGVNLGTFTYQNGTVTGEVYVTKAVYDDAVNKKIWVQIEKNDNGTWSVYEAVYRNTVNGIVYYDFSQTVTGATYLDLFAQYQSVSNSVYYDSVTKRVYDTTPSGNTGGGFVLTPSNGVITVGSNGVVSASQLSAAFAQSATVTVEISGESATLPVSALRNAPEGAVVVVKSSVGSYVLPVSAIDFDALAEELGVDVEDLDIRVIIAALKGEEAEEVAAAAEEFGGEALASVEFSVEAVAGNETVAISDFGSTYVERTINVDADSSATGVLYDPATGEFSFIPATFADGVATLKSTTNSIYVVLELDNSFADVNGHWAQSYVETMANKLIVEGYENGTFGPDRQITRAEFATLIVRALGLSGKAAGEANFSDVSSNDWFAGAVALAAEAGIVNGYEDGTFQPNKVITREELAAMVVRASAFAGTELSVNASQVSSILAGVKDASSIVWARAEIAAAINAGIVEGYEDGSFGAVKTATRAEASTMIQRFLVNAGFINE
ncbi:S-layer homology domain-containing protein [Paenibacillus sp.]|uniref:S-layer homology domain-containing protein n=1 Tax=Paenibacillus sp. TaxID=58172 RepID=UPI002D4FB8F9|nr:S-layer homology domain-containing protein [Paenibacillus sp.]HZG86167.1 S-layer homology domain-containing protein [Paenibacillus sp.]